MVLLILTVLSSTITLGTTAGTSVINAHVSNSLHVCEFVSIYHIATSA